MTLLNLHTNSAQVVEVLKAMSHPERLMILCQLTKGEMGVGRLLSTSRMSQSALSQHLTVLRKSNLVRFRKESQHVFYSLSDERVVPLIKQLGAICRD